jgi:hypothetical protein
MKKDSCPHCGAKYSDNQPASGLHAWDNVYDCGYSETHWAGEDEGEVSNNCPHQKYKGYRPIHVFVEEQGIDVPQRGSIEYSDMYCDIYEKFPNRKLHTWMAMEPDGRKIKRMMLFYRVKDLKEYFNVHAKSLQ